MPEQATQSPIYRYRDKDWSPEELAVEMGWEARRLAMFGQTRAFPADYVIAWQLNMLATRMAAQDDAETFAA